jgi:hypothetical protein
MGQGGASFGDCNAQQQQQQHATSLGHLADGFLRLGDPFLLELRSVNRASGFGYAQGQTLCAYGQRQQEE